MRFLTNNWLFILVFSLILIGLAGLGSAQTNISNSSNWFSTCPRIAVDSAGNVHVIWVEFYTMNGYYPQSGDAYHAKYDITTKRWSTPINLSNSGQCFSGEWYSVGIDADGSGNVYAVYVDGPSLKLRILSGGSWSSPFDVATAGGADLDSARVAVDAAGDIFVVCRYAGVVYSRARVGGVWEGVATLTYPRTVSKFPEISVGANQVYCVFEDNHFTPTYYTAVCVRRAKTYGAAWSSSQRMTNAANWEEHPAVRVDANDVAHVVFTPYYDSTASRDVRYVEGTSSGWSAPVVLGTLGNVHYPSLAVRGTNVFTCWQANGLHYRNRVDGAWGAESPVPNAVCDSLTDVASSPTQDKLYYVWDTGSGDIYFSELAGPGPFGPLKPQYWISVGDMKGNRRVDFLGTCAGIGTYYRDSVSGNWVQMTCPAEQITAGDLDGDGIDDLIGMWAQDQGIWAKFSSTGTWAQLDATKADWIGVGDMNGDGRKDFIASWSGWGVYYRDSVSGAWTKITTPAEKITAGDLDGDGIDDLIGIWAESEGIWAKFSKTGTWAQLDAAKADWIGVGDMNGDGRTDFLGTYGGWGVYYRDSVSGAWTKITTPAEQVTAGDLDGDGTDDLIGIWPGDLSIWAKFSGSNTWSRLITYNGSASLTVEKMMETEAEMKSGSSQPVQKARFGGQMKYSPYFGEYEDLSANGRGRAQAQNRMEEWGTRKIDKEIQSRMLPGPGSAGFKLAIDEAGGRARKKQN
jgi:hypothetical protein